MEREGDRYHAAVEVAASGVMVGGGHARERQENFDRLLIRSVGDEGVQHGVRRNHGRGRRLDTAGAGPRQVSGAGRAGWWFTGLRWHDIIPFADRVLVDPLSCRHGESSPL